MEATNQLSETKLISLDITEAKSLLMRLLCVTTTLATCIILIYTAIDRPLPQCDGIKKVQAILDSSS